MAKIERKERFGLGGCRLIWHMDRVHQWAAGERIAPIHIDMGLTKRCNIRCQFCYGAFQKMTGEMIKEDALLRLVDSAAQVGVKSIAFVGDGEPTLNPAMYRALIKATNKNIRVGISTSGVKIDVPGIITEHADYCRINIGSATPWGYSKIHRVHGSVQQTVVKNIEQLVRYRNTYSDRCLLLMQTVLVPDALDELVGLAKLAVELGVDGLLVKQFSDPGSGIPSRGFDKQAHQERRTAILKEAEALSTERTKIFVKWNAMGWENGRPYKRCIDLPFIFQISGNGKCYPCGYHFGNPKYCYGDIHTQSLQEILNSDTYWRIIEDMRINFDAQTQCQGTCRHDNTNIWLHDWLDRPQHVDFI